MGETWGYRQKARTLGESLRPVEVLQLGPTKSRKVRICWLDGEYAGLDEWVPAQRLIVEWAKADDFMADEAGIVDLMEIQPAPLEPVTLSAVQEVFFTGCDAVTFLVEPGRALTANVNLEALASSPFRGLREEVGMMNSFTDSSGLVHIGQVDALHLAQLMCVANPRAVLERADREESRAREAVVTGWWQSEFFEPYRIDRKDAQTRLEDRQAINEVLRRWCGTAATVGFDEVTALRAEIDRLQGILDRTARWLREAGHAVKAAEVLRQIGSVPTEPTVRGRRGRTETPG